MHEPLDYAIDAAGIARITLNRPKRANSIDPELADALMAALEHLAADFPSLTIVMAHPGYPWIDETTAVALHKGNVYWEMSGWAPKYLPPSLVRDMRGRLQDKMMFGSDYPSTPYARILTEWKELGYKDEVMEKIFHWSAERILGL